MRAVVASLLILALGSLMAGPMAAALGELETRDAPGVNSAGWTAAQRLRGPSGLYYDGPGGQQAFVAHQMIAVLSALQAAKLRPDSAAKWNAEALAAWNRSAQSYDTVTNFFARTVPPPDQQTCIDAETNSWALWAAAALTQALGGTPEFARRGSELTTTLDALLSTGSFRGKPACFPEAGSLRFFQRPLVLLAFLEWRTAANDLTLDRLIRAEIERLLTRYLEAGGFEEGGIFYNAPNAQALAALTRAHALYNDTAIRSARDQVASFLTTEMIRPGATATLAFELETTPEGRRPLGTGTPQNQIWSALALDVYRRHGGTVNPPDLGARLLESLVALYWKPEHGTFVSSGGLVTFEPNGLSGFASLGPRIAGLTRDAASLAAVVLASDAVPAATSNTWTIRFSLTPTSTSERSAILAVNEFTVGTSGIGNSPRLLKVQGGQWRSDPTASFIPGVTDLVRFQAPAGPSATFLAFEVASPVKPVASEIQKSITIGLENTATDKVIVGSLQLDIQVTNVSVQGITFNDSPITALDVRDPVVTDALRVPHLRVLLGSLDLPPGTSTIRISYSDVEPPSVRDVLLSYDAQGREPLPTRQPVALTEGRNATLFASIADNARVRQAVVLFRVGELQIQKPMVAVPERPGVYAVELPAVLARGRADVTIRAVDAWDNLQETTIALQVENPLLVGNQVLFVFSGILFVSAFVIWLKVRRKGIA